MKAQDLKHPTSWEERRPILQDQVLFVPEFYEHHEQFEMPAWHSEAVFGNHNPVHVEYCSGNGTWICERAAAQPEINWVAVEKRFDRVRKIWYKAKKRGLRNLLVVSGEAHTATRYYFPSRTVAEAYVNFPDPWPKDRHAKHRLITVDFVTEVERVLLDAGTFTLVTDDANYSAQMVEALLACGGLQALSPEPFYVTELAGYGTSFFDSLWRREGREIRYHQFCRRIQELNHAS